MKAQTICTIKSILEQKVKEATNNYRNNEAILIQKLGDDYERFLSHFDKLTHNRLARELSECHDLLDDFNEHNWN